MSLKISSIESTIPFDYYPILPNFGTEDNADDPVYAIEDPTLLACFTILSATFLT
jgi:hypothetical protein